MEDVWRYHDGRPNGENRIEQRKEDIASNGFCVSSYDCTEVVFRPIRVLFNVMGLFQREVLGDTTSRLMSLRKDVRVVAVLLASSAGQQVSRLGLRGRRQARFAVCLDRIRALPRSLHRAAVDQARCAVSVSRSGGDAYVDSFDLRRIVAAEPQHLGIPQLLVRSGHVVR